MESHMQYETDTSSPRHTIERSPIRYFTYIYDVDKFEKEDNRWLHNQKLFAGDE